jgi:conjugative transfer region protein (TIGR03748 family)
MKSIKIIFIALTSLMLTSVTHATLAADNATHIGRYLNVPNIPLTSQADLLTQTFQVRFPSSVKTINDAIRYLLRFSGYTLTTDDNLIAEVKRLLSLPLPQTDRALGPLSLEQGLLTLVGKPFGLLVDPVHRLINFRLLPQYKPLYKKASSFLVW